MIHYKGKDYETRDITICPNDIAYTVTVAKRELWNTIEYLVYDKSPVECKIDDSIAYYCDDDEWALDDAHLANLLETL